MWKFILIFFISFLVVPCAVLVVIHLTTEAPQTHSIPFSDAERLALKQSIEKSLRTEQRKPRSPQTGGIVYQSKPRSPQTGGIVYQSKPRSPQTGGIVYQSKPRSPQTGGIVYQSKPRSPQTGGIVYQSKPRSPQTKGSNHALSPTMYGKLAAPVTPTSRNEGQPNFIKNESLGVFIKRQDDGSYGLDERASRAAGYIPVGPTYIMRDGEIVEAYDKNYGVYVNPNGDPQEISHNGVRGLFYRGRFTSWQRFQSSGIPADNINALRQVLDHYYNVPTSMPVSEHRPPTEDPNAIVPPLVWKIISAIGTVLTFKNELDKIVDENKEKWRAEKLERDHGFYNEAVDRVNRKIIESGSGKPLLDKFEGVGGGGGGPPSVRRPPELF